MRSAAPRCPYFCPIKHPLNQWVLHFKLEMACCLFESIKPRYETSNLRPPYPSWRSSISPSCMDGPRLARCFWHFGFSVWSDHVFGLLVRCMIAGPDGFSRIGFPALRRAVMREDGSEYPFPVPDLSSFSALLLACSPVGCFRSGGNFDDGFAGMLPVFLVPANPCPASGKAFSRGCGRGGFPEGFA